MNSTSLPQDSVLTVLPIALSAIAIAVSLTTASVTVYLQYFRKPRAKLLISRWVRAWVGDRQELVLNVGVSVANFGAQYAVITQMRATLSKVGSSSEVTLEWNKFISFENTGTKGENFKPHGSFAGWADYLVVPNRQAVASTIQFGSQRPFALLPGDYRLSFSAYGETRSDARPLASATIAFAVDQQRADRFADAKADPETKVTKKSVSFSAVQI